MFNFFRKKSSSEAGLTPPPLPAQSRESSDPFIKSVVGSGEHAENEIEGLIGFFRMGIMTPHEFFPAILKKDFITICSERSDPNSALFLKRPDGTSRLAVFTSEAKAKKLFELHPTFSHAFDVTLEVLLRSLPAEAGFVINPSFEAMTMQVSPEQLAHIKADFINPTN